MIKIMLPYKDQKSANVVHKQLADLSRKINVDISPVYTSRKIKDEIKAGVNPKAVFWLGIMFLMQISCLRFKQSRISMLISHIYVLGCFVNFLVIFWYIWREIVFLKGLVKLMEIGNFEDLLLF